MTAKKRKTLQQRVEFYLRQGREYATTTFNAVGAFAMPFAGHNAPMRLVEHDAELMMAIEGWRLRQLAAIDGQLRELGIADPETLQDDLEKLGEDYRKSRLGVIEAAMQARREPEYSMFVLGGCTN